MPEHTTDDGCRLAYEVVGRADAPLLVLSNSLGTDRKLWDPQAAAFAGRFRLLRYDTRGHGASDAPPGDYTIDRLGRDVLSLMDHIGARRAHVAGISIGGLTALWLGAHASERVGRLVLANTAAKIGTPDMWAERLRQIDTDGLASLADGTMARWFTDGFREAHPDTVARTRATFVATAVEGYLGCCAALRDTDLRGAATRVVAPALVITGTHDVATTPADGAWLAGAIPGATLVELDAAHLSNLGCAAAFTGAVMRFLTD
ncbi:MAG: 3-oxoadipate enol-lactonase [Vicinamibacterales bacterium]